MPESPVPAPGDVIPDAAGPRLSATNVDATAVNTLAWLSTPSAIVVPVYQRQYRWDIGGCEQLLADIRTVADADPRHMHFIGSILSATGSATGGTELVLIDGQQRVTTLMLLIAALHDTVREGDPDLAARLEQVLRHPADPGRTRLRPHRAWADVFESVALDRRDADDAARDSRFDDNYAFFRSQITPLEAPRIWRGLSKLEHVAITLGPGANAQQIFESLNSTGEPLRDHELIHNYVLMGLSHAEQTEIEDDFWGPIERDTGESIGAFWQHYLVMETGREVTVVGGRGVYEAFRERFPRLDVATLRARAAEWREAAEVYRILLEPDRASDPEVGRQLRLQSTFGRGMDPLVMSAYRDFRRGSLDASSLVRLLEYLQSLVLRRTLIGLPAQRIVARLCRARAESPEALERAIARICPSDQRVRVALKYRELPHPVYVLGRIAGVDDLAAFDLEHVVPLAPGDSWSGDGVRAWAEYSDDEQNAHRALAPTLGNLALLEADLSEAAFDRSFPDKRAVYARSRIAQTAELAGADAWGTAQLAERTSRLSDEFVRVWPRPGYVHIDDDGLTPVLDATRRRGWPRGWEREFDYVEYRGEHWEVKDVKELFNRIVKRLWADGREHVVAYTARRGGPVYPSRAWTGHWDELDAGHFLYMGWDSTYMLGAVQGLLEDAGIASEVFVKYSYLGEVLSHPAG